MKLPTDYVVHSLGDLKRVVVLIATGAEKYNETLEMTEAQYLRYKELVWREDPIRFYNGMEIKLAPKSGLDEKGDGEHRRGEQEPELGKGESQSFHAESIRGGG
jgi:hypothetical protein